MLQLLMLIGLAIVAFFVLQAVIGLTLGLIGLVFMILVWIFIGWLTGQLVRGRGYGPVTDAMLGLGGAIVGNIVLALLGVDLGGPVGTIIAGVVGALILVFIGRAMKS